MREARQGPPGPPHSAALLALHPSAALNFSQEVAAIEQECLLLWVWKEPSRALSSRGFPMTWQEGEPLEAFSRKGPPPSFLLVWTLLVGAPVCLAGGPLSCPSAGTCGLTKACGEEGALLAGAPEGARGELEHVVGAPDGFSGGGPKGSEALSEGGVWPVDGLKEASASSALGGGLEGLFGGPRVSEGALAGLRGASEAFGLRLEGGGGGGLEGLEERDKASREDTDGFDASPGDSREFPCASVGFTQDVRGLARGFAEPGGGPEGSVGGPSGSVGGPATSAGGPDCAVKDAAEVSAKTPGVLSVGIEKSVRGFEGSTPGDKNDPRGAKGLAWGPQRFARGPGGLAKGFDGLAEGPGGLTSGSEGLAGGPESIAGGPGGGPELSAIVSGPEGLTGVPKGLTEAAEGLAGGPADSGWGGLEGGFEGWSSEDFAKDPEGPAGGVKGFVDGPKGFVRGPKGFRGSVGGLAGGPEGLVGGRGTRGGPEGPSADAGEDLLGAAAAFLSDPVTSPGEVDGCAAEAFSGNPGGFGEGPEGLAVGPDCLAEGPKGLVGAPEGFAGGPGDVGMISKDSTGGPKDFAGGPDGFIEGPECSAGGPEGLAGGAVSFAGDSEGLPRGPGGLAGGPGGLAGGPGGSAGGLEGLTGTGLARASKGLGAGPTSLGGVAEGVPESSEGLAGGPRGSVFNTEDVVGGPGGSLGAPCGSAERCPVAEFTEAPCLWRGSAEAALTNAGGPSWGFPRPCAGAPKEEGSLVSSSKGFCRRLDCEPFERIAGEPLDGLGVPVSFTPSKKDERKAPPSVSFEARRPEGPPSGFGGGPFGMLAGPLAESCGLGVPMLEASEACEEEAGAPPCVGSESKRVTRCLLGAPHVVIGGLCLKAKLSLRTGCPLRDARESREGPLESNFVGAPGGPFSPGGPLGGLGFFNCRASGPPLGGGSSMLLHAKGPSRVRAPPIVAGETPWGLLSNPEGNGYLSSRTPPPASSHLVLSTGPPPLGQEAPLLAVASQGDPPHREGPTKTHFLWSRHELEGPTQGAPLLSIPQQGGRAHAPHDSSSFAVSSKRPCLGPRRGAPEEWAAGRVGLEGDAGGSCSSLLRQSTAAAASTAATTATAAAAQQQQQQQQQQICIL
ncbi:hypothetical protein Emag_003840 [Eimeria magna]